MAKLLVAGLVFGVGVRPWRAPGSLLQTAMGHGRKMPAVTLRGQADLRERRKRSSWQPRPGRGLRLRASFAR